MDFITTFDFRKLSLEELSLCIVNNGLLPPTFELADRYTSRQLLAYAGPSSVPGRFRYVVADIVDGEPVVSEAWVYIGVNGKLCADFSGWPAYKATSVEDAIVFVDQERRKHKMRRKHKL